MTKNCEFKIILLRSSGRALVRRKFISHTPTIRLVTVHFLTLCAVTKCRFSPRENCSSFLTVWGNAGAEILTRLSLGSNFIVLEHVHLPIMLKHPQAHPSVNALN